MCTLASPCTHSLGPAAVTRIRNGSREIPDDHAGKKLRETVRTISSVDYFEESLLMANFALENFVHESFVHETVVHESFVLKSFVP